MIVTEQKAKGCACPFASSFNAGGGAVFFNGTTSSKHAECIASRCMSWEWTADEYIYPHAQTRKELAALGIMVPEEVRPPFNNGTEQAEAELQSWIDIFGDPQSFNWARVNDTRMLEAGWEFAPHIEEKHRFIGGTQSYTRWRRLNPARTGQCGRTVIISVERD
jgi:hypothetical protein